MLSTRVPRKDIEGLKQTKLFSGILLASSKKLEFHLWVFVSDLAGYKPDRISEGLLCLTGVMANGAPFLGRIQQGPSTPLPLPGSCISGACKITSWMMRQTLPQTDKAGSRSACSLQVWLIDSSLNRQPEGIFFLFKAINRKRMCGEGAPTFKRPSFPPSLPCACKTERLSRP